MCAASIAGPWAPLPAVVHAVEAAALRGDSTESALLAQFAEYERAEAVGHQEPLAGSLASLASVMPGGDGDVLRFYSDVHIPADGYTFDEVRGVALRDELLDHQGLPCAPSSTPKKSFSPHALIASKHLGVVSSMQAAPGSGPAPPGLQAPIQSAAAAKRTGQWEGPGG